MALSAGRSRRARTGCRPHRGCRSRSRRGRRGRCRRRCSAAPAPSAMTSVAVAPEVETEASVPRDGTFVSVQGRCRWRRRAFRRRSACTRSTLPLQLTSCIDERPATRTGLAPSAGGGGERGVVAGCVADPGGVCGECDREGADGGVGGACAFGDREGGVAGGDGDGGERAAAGAFASVHGVVPAV